MLPLLNIVVTLVSIAATGVIAWLLWSRDAE